MTALYHVYAINNKTKKETQLTGYAMNFCSCNIFISKLMFPTGVHYEIRLTNKTA